MIDRRGILEENIFSYKISKERKIFIYWEGRQITTLAGNRAEEFIAKIQILDGKAAQLIMAKMTGNFKHGNEKMTKWKNK
jgi:hypothetical protein